MSILSKVQKEFCSFISELERNLSKPQRKHFEEYFLGLMIPTDKKRKSVNAINEMVGRKDQSALNRFLNGLAGKVIQNTWLSKVKQIVKNRPVFLIVDDILLEHPDAEHMEGVASFFDHTFGRFVSAHQFVTSILVTADTHEIIPFSVIRIRR